MGVLLYPPYLQWEIISDCNHKCIHCYNHWRNDSNYVKSCTEIDRIDEIAKKIIERKPLYLAITGGEPLLIFPKVKECIEKFSNNRIKCSVSTNGTLLTDEMVGFFEEKEVDLVISLPSIDQAICDEVCASKNVVDTLRKKFEIIKSYHVSVTVNIVITKLNISTLYKTLKAVNEWGFTGRVGIAQRPINASKEYLNYELDDDDFKYIVKQCIKAKNELNMPLDFSVCIPDCAFDDRNEYIQIEKGSCFAGTIAYAICTNGDVKACQCDTKTYGNIISDQFENIYNSMAEWRNGSMIPAECAGCSKLYSCKGGCRVEAYANHGEYGELPTFANIKNIPILYEEEKVSTAFLINSRFKLSEDAIFLKDKQCYRVSVGIIAVHLTNEFADWLKENTTFTFEELLNDSGENAENLSVILSMLIQNDILENIG